jgi:hypothetical protein
VSTYIQLAKDVGKMGAYADMMHMYALSAVLKVPIRSLCLTKVAHYDVPQDLQQIHRVRFQFFSSIMAQNGLEQMLILLT